MCGGGGGQRATIYQPDYDAYDREFELQRDAINQQMSNNVMSMQTQLQGTLRDQNILREKIADQKVEIADDENALQEEAMRLSTLIGAPPPEKSAQAPEIGSRDRGIKTSKGKKSLRIGRTANSSSQGTGLNIT
tara:strand:- start:1137 stop:1538 length:402 start_codon:yes stop_codon:yes gene_type:complete